MKLSLLVILSICKYSSSSLSSWQTEIHSLQDEGSSSTHALSSWQAELVSLEDEGSLAKAVVSWPHPDIDVGEVAAKFLVQYEFSPDITASILTNSTSQELHLYKDSHLQVTVSLLDTNQNNNLRIVGSTFITIDTSVEVTSMYVKVFVVFIFVVFLIFGIVVLLQYRNSRLNATKRINDTFGSDLEMAKTFSSFCVYQGIPDVIIKQANNNIYTEIPDVINNNNKRFDQDPLLLTQCKFTRK